ncbi:MULTISPECIES: TIGR03759 family integrating conjugative element protein [unclassified Serratia (in: enterobacteria)]|uniref:TIGR03759 family integrating conjugative element protein n=1 Tax=unclassified Serratia (in: enterobacteria) TaxID=2647522 RepID=UPI0030767FF6
MTKVLFCTPTLVGVYLTGLFLTGQAVAQNTAPATSQPATIQHSQLRDSAVDKTDTMAREWGLKADEYARYQTLMQGPLGVHSPGLDPLTALGIEAKTDAERRRYAELQVEAEGRRVAKLLAYQQAYDDAWKRLHPTLLPMALTGSQSIQSPITSPAENGRLTVFVKAVCPPCVQKVKALQRQGARFDVYMIDSQQDDGRIRQWAAQAGIDPARVRNRTITLNHDSGQWQALGKAVTALPVVLPESP